MSVSHRILAVGVLGEFGWIFLLPWLLAGLALAFVAFIGYWPLV
ncbi:MAG: hypothetical protein ACR2GQ_01265 [Gemmatimonadota bacterium]